jgi:hypothetical protein
MRSRKRQLLAGARAPMLRLATVRPPTRHPPLSPLPCLRSQIARIMCGGPTGWITESCKNGLLKPLDTAFNWVDMGFLIFFLAEILVKLFGLGALSRTSPCHTDSPASSSPHASANYRPASLLHQLSRSPRAAF